MASPQRPANFSWVVEGKLAALAYPHSVPHLRYLSEVEGIAMLISLTAERVPPVHNVTQLEWTHIPIPDFQSPSMKQVDEYVGVVRQYNDRGRSVAVHCAHGYGRTGTLLACYYVHHDALSAERAISKIRQVRPGSIETSGQEECVRRYEKYLQWQRNNQ